MLFLYPLLVFSMVVMEVVMGGVLLGSEVWWWDSFAPRKLLSGRMISTQI